MGWSSRYNDRTGIGRFGVGMTLGAIHECRRVEVYSQFIGGEWLYTYLDLDEIEMIVGRFNKSSFRAGKLRGEVVKYLSGKVVIRHHFTKKTLWGIGYERAY
jgi:hypothetical protein